MKQAASFEGPNWVWLNGELVPWEDATTNVSTHGLNYGMGVFEGIRSYRTADGRTAVFRLDSHIDRLFASAATYSLPIPFSRQTLIDATLEVVKANSRGEHSNYIRPVCWFGPGVSLMHRPVETAIIAWPWKINLPEERTSAGLRVGISPWKKIHYSMLPSTAKGTGQYLSTLLSVKHALMSGYDDALLLDVEGNISEGPAANIFLVKNGKLLTNDEASSILLGVTRASVIKIAQDLGITVEIRSLTKEDLFEADESFFTGTAVEIVKIREVDGRQIGTTEAPVMAKIRDVFRAITSGLNPVYAQWLQYLPADAEKSGAKEDALAKASD
jgi:branched-chain amino acid aminotransferase